MKVTAKAPSNIAFIKYWGRKNEQLRLPDNGSVSMNLSNLTTTTTVEFSSEYKTDEVIIDGYIQENEAARVIAHLNRIRALSGINQNAKVVSKNSFPSGTGLSSSASGFAALTVAAVNASQLSLSEKELSILARHGSGSACRSIPDGFVEWLDGDSDESSYAISLYPSNHWEICDVVALVSKEKKPISTSEGQTRTNTSPFFETRKLHLKEKIVVCKKALKKKNFHDLGMIAEREALEMHSIMLTSWPPLIYWTEGTLQLMKQIQRWREQESIPVYFTINTGQDVHVLCETATLPILEEKLKALPYVHDTIINYPTEGAELINEHLF